MGMHTVLKLTDIISINILIIKFYTKFVTFNTLSGYNAVSLDECVPY